MEKELSLVVDKDLLFNEIKQGDIEKVKSALENGLSPNACFGKEKTPLLSIATKVKLKKK